MNNDVKQQISTPHRWQKGESGNPRGRPKNPEAEELRQALRQARKKHGNRGLVYHFVDRAYVNDNVLIALMKQVLPQGQGNTTNFVNQFYANIGINREEGERLNKRYANLDKLLDE